MGIETTMRIMGSSGEVYLTVYESGKQSFLKIRVLKAVPNDRGYVETLSKQITADDLGKALEIWDALSRK